MSLLESLRSFLGKRDQESRRPSAHPAAWPIDIDGSCEKTVYCYVGVVFKGVRKGAELYVDPLGHDVVLHSKSTGTTADSAEFGDAPLAYDGRPFGFAGSSLGFLKEMTAAGFTFRVKVKKVGMYSPGVPELVTMTADPSLLRQWWERQRSLPIPVPFSEDDEIARRDAQRRAQLGAARQQRTGIRLGDNSIEVWINVTERNWVGGELPAGDLRFTPEFEMVPTPKGSSAKPHIRILRNGMPLVEISARNTEAYKFVFANMGRPCRASYMYDYFQDVTGQVKLYLVFG